MHRENIIKKQVIDFMINAPVDGFEFQKQADSLCRNELMRNLEKLFDRYSSVDEIISLDTVSIDVEYSSITDFECSFTERIVDEIEKVLVLKISEARNVGKGSISLSQSTIKVLFFYLQNGFLPWWSGVKTDQDWRDLLDLFLSIETRSGDWTAIYPILKQRQVRTRLLQLFTANQLWTLSENITSTPLTILERDLEVLLSKFSAIADQREFRDLYFNILLRAVAESDPNRLFLSKFSELFIVHVEEKYPKLLSAIRTEDISTPEFRSAIIRSRKKEVTAFLKSDRKDDNLAENRKDIEKEPAAEKHVTDERIDNQPHKDEIYIANAGIVIVAAFLPMFFNDLRYVSKAGLHTGKAVSMLQYLIKGEVGYEEFETVLPKILCGLELNKPLFKGKLSKSEKAKGVKLLESVLEHWTVLKSTSVEGLRVSFLQREGRLVFYDNEWRLKVKQEAYDMLLSHLPWNISIIKLPWMKCFLNVEWA